MVKLTVKERDLGEPCFVTEEPRAMSYIRIWLSAAAILCSAPAIAVAEPPHNCSGNACGDIDLRWNAGRGGYDVENIGDRHINFALSAARGGFGDCPGVTVTKRIIRGRTEFFDLPSICRSVANYQ